MATTNVMLKLFELLFPEDDPTHEIVAGEGREELQAQLSDAGRIIKYWNRRSMHLSGVSKDDGTDQALDVWIDGARALNVIHRKPFDWNPWRFGDVWMFWGYLRLPGSTELLSIVGVYDTNRRKGYVGLNLRDRELWPYVPVGPRSHVHVL